MPDQVPTTKKTRQNKDNIDRISLLYAEVELNFQDLFDQMWSMRKTKQDNDVTDYMWYTLKMKLISHDIPTGCGL